MTEKETVQKQIKELWRIEKWEHINRILKNYRDSLAVKILANTWADEKVYSECDKRKLEIRMLNRILNLPNETVEVDVVLTEEEILAKEKDELDIWEVDDLFRTPDA